MMDYAHFGTGVGFLFMKLFWMAFFLGVVLFVVWAAKLDKKTLKKWFVSLLVVGVAGMLVASLLMMQFGNYKDWKGWKMDKFGEMEEMMDEVVE